MGGKPSASPGDERAVADRGGCGGYPTGRLGGVPRPKGLTPQPLPLLLLPLLPLLPFWLNAYADCAAPAEASDVPSSNADAPL